MKKWIVFVLLVALVATGVPVSAAEQPADPIQGHFSVGYGVANITPTESVPLQGYGKVEQRMSTGILTQLFATCCAITDETGNTVLIFGVDLCGSGNAAYFRPEISRATGVPQENICISASHTHSAPSTGTTTMDVVRRYNAMMGQRLVEAAVAAMADRKVAQMYGATVETTALNFVRRYVMKDGSYAGDNYGDFSKGIQGHESEVDNDMQLIKFVREGGRDVILTNFQTHPHRTGGSTKYDVSADIVGIYRDVMERDLDCRVVYFTGGSGNVNPTSRISGENVYSNYVTQGQAMAAAAKTARYTPIPTGRVQAVSQTFVGQINHAYDAYADICREIYLKWNNNEISTAQVKTLGKENGIALNSPYHANAIYNRSKMAATRSFTISAFSFGDVGFVVAPYEMFDATGMDIKTASPFEMTIIATCANGGNGYFPTELAFDHGGYSVDTTNFVRGSAEKLANQYLTMLTDLHTTEMHRLYNPNSGEHHYTALPEERDFLVNLGWKYEGVGWLAPATSDYPVYRLYNPNSGDHHYTMLEAERDFLVPLGWVYEGIGWYSEDPEIGIPLHRLFNPHLKVGSHHYTLLQAEVDFLLPLGWKYEQYGWYGVREE